MSASRCRRLAGYRKMIPHIQVAAAPRLDPGNEPVKCLYEFLLEPRLSYHAIETLNEYQFFSTMGRMVMMVELASSSSAHNPSEVYLRQFFRSAS